METARMISDKETAEEGKKSRVNIERSTAFTQKRCCNGIYVTKA